MSTHPLDREIRNRLHDGAASVPAGTWEAVQQGLQKEKKRPLPVWFWTGVALLILASLALGARLLLNSGQNNSDSVQALDQVIEMADNKGFGSTEALSSTGDFDKNSDVTEEETQKTPRIEETAESDLPAPPDIVKQTVQAPTLQHSDGEIANEQYKTVEEQSSVILEESLRSSDISSTSESSKQSRSMIMLASIAKANSGVMIDSKPDFTVTDCYSFGGNGPGGWLVELYTGPAYSLRSLESRPNENVDDYIAARDSTENGQLSWHAGARVGYEFGNGITAKLGAHYTVINEVFRLESRTVRTVTDSLFDNQGNFVRVDTTVEVGTLVEQHQNRFHSVDVPLLVGFRVDNGNWDFGIEAGPVINVLYSSQGKIIGANGSSISFSDQSDPTYTEVFKTQVGFSLYGGIYASKRIGSALWAFVEPHFQHRFGSVTRDDYPINQKQTNIGLSVGLRYKL